MIHTATYDGSLNFDTKINTDGFRSGTNTIKSQANGLKSTLVGLGKMMVAAFSVTALLAFGKQAIGTASDLTEVQNVVDTAFGDMTYKIEEFAKTSIENFGLSKLAAKQMASTYMAMSTGMGQMAGVASDMAVEITGRLGDVMSFYNKTASEADTIGKAIYTGETEPLKAIGVVMTETNLSAYALSKGMSKAYSEMSSGEKLLIRQQFFLDKTNLSAGDFVKTSGSWANQTRVLSERWKEFMGIIGQGLIQILTPTVKFLNTALSYMIEFANTVGKVLSSVFNLSSATGSTAKNTAAIGTGAEDASVGLNDMGKSAKKASKDAGNTAGFDRLNNMTESIADNSAGAADAIAGMDTGGGTYGATVKVDSDTSALETGLTGAIGNIKTLMAGLNTWITANFVPIFAGIWSDLQAPISTFKNIMSGVFTDIKSLGQPLLDYFNGPFTTYLQQEFMTLGLIAVGLFDIFNMVFSDIWNIAIFPVVQKFITDILPVLTEFGTQVWSLLGVVFTSVNTIFDMIWSDAIAPALKLATGVWMDFVDILVEFWNTYGVPIFDGIKQAWQTTTDLFVALWNKYLKPIWNAWMQVADQLWKDHLKPLLSNFMSLVGEFAKGALDIYNKFIAPIVKWFIEKFGPPITKIFVGLIGNIGEFLGNMVDAVNGIITALKGIVQFITGVFTGDWKKAWQGVKNIFKGVFDALVGIVKTPINSIIDIMNSLIGGIVTGINTVLKAINKLKIDVPKAVTAITGIESFGFNIPLFSAPKIPKLASGTVVPANYGEFATIMGDSRYPEIVSPIPAMKQAFKEAFAEMGGKGSGTINLNVYLTGKQIHSEVVRVDKEIQSQTGQSAFSPA